MKHWKRIIGLGLALTLTASLFTAAGAARFTDADKIEHTEAVDQLVEYGVIAGKEDGSYFDPNGTVTRAEMAKMIVLILNGGVDPQVKTRETPTYTDIKGTWAEGYIELCSSWGIIAGKGDGTFAPAAEVTAAEAAKMLLAALGYEPEVFGLTGSNWSGNVNALANNSDNKLYTGLEDVEGSDSLTRDQAAQMIYNTLSAKVMVRAMESINTDGSISYKYTVGEKTLLETAFDVTAGEEAE